jgi:glutamate synthase domain-containing protein 1
MENDTNDLSNRVARSTIAVVDTMTQRGAVKGEELSTLGQLRDQCVQLIQLIEAQQAEDEGIFIEDEAAPEGLELLDEPEEALDETDKND